ncbi:MAG: hypothetical protein OEN56_07995 [Gemmatimonadota bacterium]|nr:hypothetical protein [Gemmatimonadota bacterium]
MRKGLIIGLGLFASTLPASAQVAEPQALAITAQNVTARAAERTDAESGASLPGDVIEYQLTFTNHTDGPIAEVVLNDPVPQGLVFEVGSVTASREDVLVEYSLDGGSSWSDRPTVQVEEAGESVTRPAPPEAYTHVRWTVTGTLNPGAQVQARFRARVAGGTDPGGEA